MKVAIYARYSSDNQRQESIDAQIRFLSDYASKNQLQIVKTYIDEAVSATTDERENFQKMIEDSGKNIFEAILVHKLDRFARNRYDSAFYKRKLRDFGVKIISALEQFDNTPESIILESVIEGMNEYYSANLSREVKKGMKETALQCKHNGGMPPLGYDLNEDKTYRINEYEAEIVRKIFRLYLDGNGYGKILSELEGLKTKLGNSFSKRSIEVILNNEKYAGTYVFGKFKRVRINGKYVDLPNENVIRVEGGIPSIITSEQFELVKEKSDFNKENFQRFNTKIDYLLTGLLRCGECGGYLVGNSRQSGRNKETYISYECSNRKRAKTCKAKSISKEVLEERVLNDLTVFLTDKDGHLCNTLYNHYKKSNESKNAKLLILEKELKEVTAQIDTMIDTILKGMYHETMINRMTELETKKSELTVMIDSCKNTGLPITKEMIQVHLLSQSKVKEMTYENQKKTLRSFLDSATVYNDKVEAHYIVAVAHGGEGN